MSDQGRPDSPPSPPEGPPPGPDAAVTDEVVVVEDPAAPPEAQPEAEAEAGREAEAGPEAEAEAETTATAGAAQPEPEAVPQPEPDLPDAGDTSVGDAEPVADVPTEAEGASGLPGDDAPGGATADVLPAPAAFAGDDASEATGDAGAAAAESSVDGVGAAAVEQLEWQPVVSGESISWQPVVSSDEEWIYEAAQVSWTEPAGGPVEAAGGTASAEERPVASEVPFGYPSYETSTNGREDAPAAQLTSPDRPDSAPGEPPPGKPRAPAPADSKLRRQVIVLSVLTVLVIAMGVGGFLLFRDASDKGTAVQEGPPPTASPTASTVAPSELTTFHDDETGFSIRYPMRWVRLNPPVRDIRLLLTPSLNSNDAVQVRVAPIAEEATQQNLANFKAVTDPIVFGDGSAKLIQEQAILVNGKLAYHYIYTFTDQVTKTEGLKSHYFIFSGLRMYMLQFQVIPTDQFRDSAALVDQVAETFAIDAAPPPPPTTAAPTTVPPPTSVP